jgi:hypothetical protein
MPTLMEAMNDWAGYTPVNSLRLDEAAMAQARALLENTNGLPMHRWKYELSEAITTSDFPALFGGILDRELMARYAIALPDWKPYFKIGDCRDFRQRTIEKVQGNEDILPRVAEKGEYLVAPMAEAHYHMQVDKYGRQFDISWESYINDDLGAFKDLPDKFAKAALKTEAYVATNQICVAAGPNPLLFGAAITDVDGQAVTNQGVLDLTIGNLSTTLGLMARQTNMYGEELGIAGLHLVVPRALELQARAVLTSALKQWTEVGGGGGIPVPTVNVLTQMGIQLHVNNLLSRIDASGNRNGTWYLFADPSEGAAVEFDYLRGHENPEICMKGSDKVSVGGGPLDPFSGDFGSDNVFYRVRHCMGAGPLDPRFAYAQVHT